ncbi:phosphocarrier protein HPr domain protein [Enterococcus durans]|uniref:phosphocarrier protein HPr domain protein n=1 Tax=Enterococcus durans TaxID=53345 RepID=UPI0039A461F5
MISLTIFWCVIGGLLAMLGAYLIHESTKGKKYTVVGIILFVVGILVAIGAEINLYLNGTTEELMWFLLWTRD